MTNRQQRNIEPGKGDIYTWFDCDDYSWFMDATGVYRLCKLRQPGVLIFRHAIDCKVWRERGECPWGYSA